jgi:general secretion pathway protein G
MNMLINIDPENRMKNRNETECTAAPVKRLRLTARSGFTLVELMIVVVIIGILASMATVRYMSVREKTRIAYANIWCNRIAKAIETLGAETGEWPGHTPAGYTCFWPNNEVYDLSTGPAGLIKNDSPKKFPDWQGPYIETIPKDPWGTKYAWDSDYWSASENKWLACVYSFGPNKKGVNIYDEDNICVIVSAIDLPDIYYE